MEGVLPAREQGKKKIPSWVFMSDGVQNVIQMQTISTIFRAIRFELLCPDLLSSREEGNRKPDFLRAKKSNQITS